MQPAIHNILKHDRHTYEVSREIKVRAAGQAILDLAHITDVLDNTVEPLFYHHHTTKIVLKRGVVLGERFICKKI